MKYIKVSLPIILSLFILVNLRMRLDISMPNNIQDNYEPGENITIESIMQEKHNEEKNEEEKPKEEVKPVKPTVKPKEEKPKDTPSKSEENKKEENVSTVTSKGYKLETINGITYVDGYLIVNKTYSLPSTFYPTNTRASITNEVSNSKDGITKETYEAFQKMNEDAIKEGLNLWIQSGYRSYNYQKALYNGYVKRSGKASADTFSARPGHSEHQSGLAFDLNSISDSFSTTKEGIWVHNNAYKYGLILRYPKGKENETGYKYESWHLRYTGTDLSYKLYNNGDWISMESYFGIDSKY